MTEPRDLNDLLDRIAPETPHEGKVSVRELLGRVGDQGFGAILLVPALLMISPLSAVPGTPTISALIIITITAQWLFGRPHLWLPDFLMRRRISERKLADAVKWLRKPARWVDRISRDRLRFLARRPVSIFSKLLIIAITATWPLLEILPMVTSIGAATIALITFGTVIRDGLFIVAGYGALGGIAFTVNYFVT